MAVGSTIESFTVPDPNTSPIPAAVRQFYDPNDVLVNDNRLLNWIAESRTPQAIPGLGIAAAEKLALIELYETGIADTGNPVPIDWLGIDQATAEQTAEAVHAHADQTARRAVDAILPAREFHFGTVGNIADVALAGAILSAKAHQGVYRLNDKPYFEHPKSVAIILEGSWLRHLGENDGLHLDLHKVRAFVHDSFEYSIPKDGSTFMHSQSFLVTPLMVRLMLGRLEIPEKLAIEVQDDLLALSKTYGPDGPVDYIPNYIVGKVAKRAGAIPTKLGDGRHNGVLDPKIAPIHDPAKAWGHLNKQAEYIETQGKLLRHLGNAAGITLELVQFGHSIVRFDIEEMRRYAPMSTLAPLEHDRLVRAYDLAA